MTDQDHAQAIKAAASELNSAIMAASDAGLRVEVETIKYQRLQNEYGTPTISATAFRPLGK